ncbi:MAG: hypothetical protein LBI88_06965, partial [Deltaproteobacteria bacterium]|nr:hypothetical protein [Deltaproteobacteria bacterium]
MKRPVMRCACRFIAIARVGFGPGMVLRLVLGLLLCSVFSPAAAMAGQTVIVDTTVTSGVAGNSPDTNGAYPPSGGYGALLAPDGNTVIIKNSVTGDVFGGYTESSNGANSNSVTLNNGTVRGSVFGGTASNADFATANSNIVTINGGIVSGNVYGGHAENSPAGFAAAAVGNSVFINGGEVSQCDVHGGLARNYGAAGFATASSNSVFINGGKVSGDVYGGWAWSRGTPGSATATNNTVTISGNPAFGAGAILFGGYTDASPGGVAGDAFTGNTLNLNTPITIAGVQNFQFLNFTFPASQAAAMITGNVALGDATYGNSVITATTLGGTAPLRPGDSVTLINGAIANNGPDPITSATGMHGVVLNYLRAFDQATGVATVNSVQSNPQLKSLSEGFLSGVALVNQGADLIAGKGVMEAALSTKTQGLSAGNGAGFGIGTFAAISGGYSRYNTGSHVDMSGLSLLAG